MTKNEFVDRVAADSGLSKKDAGSAVDSVIRSIESALGSGEDVNFTGFGKFHVAERGAREGRNPRTGETMTIAASRVPRFTAGSGLKKAVKQ
jgi:DNA-binding protein HU-beta